MTPKQERFVQEYLVGVNATQAAIRLGYSKKTAQQQASRLLLNVKVSKTIAEGMQALVEKTGVTAKKVIDELALIGFSNMLDHLDLSDPENPIIDLSKITPEQASTIAETKIKRSGLQRRVKINLHDKLNALVTLVKHLVLFSERHLLGGLNGGEIKHTQYNTWKSCSSNRRGQYEGQFSRRLRSILLNEPVWYR